jgi:hypothetical protein
MSLAAIWTGAKAALGFVDTNKTASELAEDLSSGVDKIFYTSEEKAENAQKTYESWLEMVRALKDSEAIRSVTRRVLAV